MHEVVSTGVFIYKQLYNLYMCVYIGTGTLILISPWSCTSLLFNSSQMIRTRWIVVNDVYANSHIQFVLVLGATIYMLLGTFHLYSPFRVMSQFTYAPTVSICQYTHIYIINLWTCVYKYIYTYIHMYRVTAYTVKTERECEIKIET